MLIELLDKLIDRCIQLAGRREESSRRLFEDFVEPVHLQFEAVHSAYLESFRRYRSVVQGANRFDKVAPALLDQIQTDSLFSADQRQRLRGFLAVSCPPLVGDFVSSIQRYLDHNLSMLLGTAGSRGTGLSITWDNLWRQSLQEVIRSVIDGKLPPAEKRAECIHKLDRLVGELQESYSEVSEAYARLRSRLLRL